MKKITRKKLAVFLQTHATSDHVLDIGAGRVASNHSYTTFFPNRVTLDINPARKPDVIGDVHALPFGDNEHTTILCTEVLEHCIDPQKAIQEMSRVLKPGGKLLLTTRFVYPLHDTPHDYFRFTKYGLKELFSGWSSVEIIPETETFSALAALMQRVIFQTSLRGGKITKGLLYILVCLFERLDSLIRKEFGDIGKTKEDSHILSTGYYVVAIK